MHQKATSSSSPLVYRSMPARELCIQPMQGGRYFTAPANQFQQQARNMTGGIAAHGSGDSTSGISGKAEKERAEEIDLAHQLEAEFNKEKERKEAEERVTAKKEAQQNRADRAKKKQDAELRLMAHALANNNTLGYYQRAILEEYCDTYSLSGKDQKLASAYDVADLEANVEQIMAFVRSYVH